MTGEIFAEWKSLEHGENTVKIGQTRCIWSIWTLSQQNGPFLVNLDRQNGSSFVNLNPGLSKWTGLGQFCPSPKHDSRGGRGF